MWVLGTTVNKQKQDMKSKETNTSFYIGTITYIKDDPEGLLDKDPTYHEIVLDIPGVAEGIKAFPVRGEVDEQKPGDLVIVCVHDPEYFSYNTYQKLKENDFVGFRAHGKMVDITPDYITVGVFEKGADEYKDAERPDVTPYAHVKLTSAGEIDVHSKGNVTVTNDADVSITISGNSDITINGNCNIKVSGSCNIDSPDVNITGASLTVNGTAAPSGSGPFCGIPACLFTGAPHVGNKSTGN